MQDGSEKSQGLKMMTTSRTSCTIMNDGGATPTPWPLLPCSCPLESAAQPRERDMLVDRQGRWPRATTDALRARAAAAESIASRDRASRRWHGARAASENRSQNA